MEFSQKQIGNIVYAKSAAFKIKKKEKKEEEKNTERIGTSKQERKLYSFFGSVVFLFTISFCFDSLD